MHLRHLLGVVLANTLDTEVSVFEAQRKAAAAAAAAAEGEGGAVVPASLDLNAITPRLRKALELALMQVLTPAPAVTLHLLQRL